MKTMGFLVVAAFFSIARSGFAQNALPEGPGQQTTVRVCGQCHEAQRAASIKLTRQGWNDEIEKMKALGANGTDPEFGEILEYLATNFKGELDRPVDMNSADAIELESVLGLLRREAAAVLQYRSKRAPFTSWTDLKDLDPAILKKIDAKKDRIVFLSPIPKR
jgi:competence protein ComEA